MNIKELIVELLNLDDMGDKIYFRYEDEEGREHFFAIDGIAYESDKFRDKRGVTHQTLIAYDA